MKSTRKRPFDVFLPGSKDQPPRLVETIKVEVYDNFGEEFLTQESRERIESVKARHLGLMSGADIKALRKRFRLTQGELADLIGCAEKSLPRWENGNGYPSGVVNRMLRLLDEGYVAPASLLAVSGPRPVNPWIEMIQPASSHRRKPLHYTAFAEKTELPAPVRGRNDLETLFGS